MIHSRNRTTQNFHSRRQSNSKSQPFNRLAISFIIDTEMSTVDQTSDKHDGKSVHQRFHTSSQKQNKNHSVRNIRYSNPINKLHTLCLILLYI